MKSNLLNIYLQGMQENSDKKKQEKQQKIMEERRYLDQQINFQDEEERKRKQMHKNALFNDQLESYQQYLTKKQGEKNKKISEKSNSDIFCSDSNRQKEKYLKEAGNSNYNSNNNNNFNSKNISPYNNINTVHLNNQNNANFNSNNYALNISNMEQNQPINNNISSNIINQDDLNKKKQFNV